MTGGKYENSKTLISVDFTTLCDRKRRGQPCAYCYVDASRKFKFNAFKVVNYNPYNGFVRRLKRSTVKRLNAMGGIRLFAAADYSDWFYDDVMAMLNDCAAIGLQAKAITKVLQFVHKFHEHPALRVINVSIDSLGPERGSQVSLQTAYRYRSEWPKVWIRAAIMNDEDLEYFGAIPYVDILTLNHKMIRGFHKFTHKELRAAAKRYPGRVCCTTGSCQGCKIRCGPDTPILKSVERRGRLGLHLRGKGD